MLGGLTFAAGRGLLGDATKEVPCDPEQLRTSKSYNRIVGEIDGEAQSDCLVCLDVHSAACIVKPAQPMLRALAISGCAS